MACTAVVMRGGQQRNCCCRHFKPSLCPAERERLMPTADRRRQLTGERLSIRETDANGGCGSVLRSVGKPTIEGRRSSTGVGSKRKINREFSGYQQKYPYFYRL